MFQRGWAERGSLSAELCGHSLLLPLGCDLPASFSPGMTDLTFLLFALESR